MYSQYLSDTELKALIGDQALIHQMLRVEIALAKVQAKQGIIPKSAAKEIDQKLKDFAPAPELLAEGTLQNGIPTISLLAFAKKELSREAQSYLHWGATSQDIMDTATVLVVKSVLKILKKRLTLIIANLKKLAKKHEQTYMVARTRTQQAIPISFSLKVVGWVQPLERHLERLEQMKPRLLVVQFGGAGGNLAALDKEGMATAQFLAKALKLNDAGVWHNQRDNIVEFSNWLALVSGSLGKIAQDILLLSQTEIGEVTENEKGGGKSSTMPHKNNPILSEAVLALARYAGNLAGANYQAIPHAHERDAATWILEWLTLPQLMLATGTGLNHFLVISKNIKVNKKAMQANLEKLNGLVFSEQASFVLTKYMSRSEAKKAVGDACQLVMKENVHLSVALQKLLPNISVNWKEVLQPKNYQGATAQLIKKND